MDTNTQNVRPKNHDLSHHLIFGAIGLVVLLVGMGAVYVWQHHKVNELNNKLNNYQAAMIKDSKISLDNLEARTALPNTVLDTANSPTDLIAFLGSDNTQCYKQQEVGYYKVISQTGDKFAKLQYGCANKSSNTPLGALPAYILAEKTNGTWHLISPTDQWLPINGQDVPSCTMVEGNNKVSKLVTPECWQGPTLSSNSSVNRTVVPVTNP